jgi:choloylglycine hydrolase
MIFFTMRILMKKFSQNIFLACLLTGSSLMPFKGFACTDFMLKGQDNTYVVGRSMEFGVPLPVQIQIFPKGENKQSPAPNNQNGMTWTSQYAYLGMVLSPSKVIVDGFNEKGLSVGALWFPGVKYPVPSSASPESTIFFADITTWLLGNFSNIEQAKEVLQKVNIYAGAVPGFPEIPPMHLSIHDANGKSLVVEFLDGKINLFDNPVGVLTNAPEFPWQVTNLRNYLNLSVVNKGPVKIDGNVLEPTGQGNGLLGIPGDWTPPSRFVKIAYIKQALDTP